MSCSDASLPCSLRLHCRRAAARAEDCAPLLCAPLLLQTDDDDGIDLRSDQRPARGVDLGVRALYLCGVGAAPRSVTVAWAAAASSGASTGTKLSSLEAERPLPLGLVDANTAALLGREQRGRALATRLRVTDPAPAAAA
jgi:hypothetical protein